MLKPGNYVNCSGVKCRIKDKAYLLEYAEGPEKGKIIGWVGEEGLIETTAPILAEDPDLDMIRRIRDEKIMKRSID